MATDLATEEDANLETLTELNIDFEIEILFKIDCCLDTELDKEM